MTPKDRERLSRAVKCARAHARVTDGLDLDPAGWRDVSLSGPIPTEDVEDA